MLDIPIPQIGYKWRGVGCWRNVELIPYIFQRENWHCWVSGCFGTDLSCHESLITRAEFQGIRPKQRQILFYSVYNSIALCSKHHNTELEPKRLDVFVWVCHYYGKESVYEWLTNISKEFKVVPPFVRSLLV